MTKSKRGFTLIEVLVVVLIIGILAAVAVPQYKKAVERAKAAEALTLLRAVYKAAVVYQLGNGSWPHRFADLDVSLPASWTGTGQVVWNGAGGGVQDSISGEDWTMELVHVGQSEFLQIGRLTGPYRGVGFFIFHNRATGSTGSQITCSEQNSQWAYFTYIKGGGKRGDYCNKVMHAKSVNGEYVLE